MSLLFEISDTSKLMIMLECCVSVPNYWCAIAMVVHTLQHAQQSRMGDRTVVKINAPYVLPCHVGGFTLLCHKRRAMKRVTEEVNLSDMGRVILLCF